jgi:pimeloyl-ACP methyl ester carboxylesterase
MRLASKWQNSPAISAPRIEHERIELIRVGGKYVEVVRLGRGEPLILVPGLAGSWRLVLPLARSLARYYAVTTYGLCGDEWNWGIQHSQPRLVCNIGGYAQELAVLIERLGLECPTVFGVSFGGAIALELAVERPHRLGALIVHGAAARFRASLGSTIARRVLERFPLPSDNRFVNQFFHLLYGAKPEPGPLVDFVTERIWETDQSVMAGRLAQLESFDVSDRLWRIEVPTLVLAGGRDVIVPAARQQELAGAIPGAHFEPIENAGHIGFLTHRGEVVREVRGHLGRVKAAV